MKFDIVGRINNMRLPDGKAAILYSVYEAVSNSVHSIEDRFGADLAAEEGEIVVDVDTDGSGCVQTISITDNGAGFTDKNLEAFNTCDSRSKLARGGKGVGRLVWLKVFGEIQVASRFKVGEAVKSLSFLFAPLSGNAIQNMQDTAPTGLHYGARISLMKVSEPFKKKMRKISFLRDLSLHFFSYFMAGTMPRVKVIFDGSSESLHEFIKGRIDTPKNADFELQLDGDAYALKMDHMFVDGTISAELKNTILLTAHDRLVGEPIDIERKFALNELSGGKAYVGLVSGKFLNDRVDQERVGFKITKEQEEALRDAIIRAAGLFLGDHIARMRTRQSATVTSLLQEHPQLAAKVEDVESVCQRALPRNGRRENRGEPIYATLP